MPTVELSEDKFEAEVLKSSGITIIDWWAPWCGPCRAFAPVYEKVSEGHPDIKFAKVNTEAEPQLGAAFEIRAIPTLMIFRDGILLFARPGMLPGEALEELIGKVRALDMDDVRKQIAAAEKTP